MRMIKLGCLCILLLSLASLAGAQNDTKLTWFAPEGSPLAVRGTPNGVYLVNITESVIVSYTLGCIKTTKRGLALLPLQVAGYPVRLKYNEAALESRHDRRKLADYCLAHSAAVAPIAVKFVDGLEWRAFPAGSSTQSKGGPGKHKS